MFEQLHPWTLWVARDKIMEALACTYISSLATGEALEDERVANVVLLFKKSSKGKLGNYRLASLICCGKVVRGGCWI